MCVAAAYIVLVFVCGVQLIGFAWRLVSLVCSVAIYSIFWVSLSDLSVLSERTTRKCGELYHTSHVGHGLLRSVFGLMVFLPVLRGKCLPHLGGVLVTNSCFTWVRRRCCCALRLACRLPFVTVGAVANVGGFYTVFVFTCAYALEGRNPLSPLAAGHVLKVETRARELDVESLASSVTCCDRRHLCSASLLLSLTAQTKT
eukprot:4070235-Amphidinium_carterae.2